MDAVQELKLIKDHPFKIGDKVCNAYSEWECVIIDDDNILAANIIEGHPKVYILKEKKSE